MKLQEPLVVRAAPEVALSRDLPKNGKCRIVPVEQSEMRLCDNKHRSLYLIDCTLTPVMIDFTSMDKRSIIRLTALILFTK